MKEKAWRKGNPHTLLVGIYIGTVTIKDSLRMPEKKKEKKNKQTRELSLEFDIPTPGPISQENHNSVRHMHPNVHCRLLTTAKTQNQQNAPHPLQTQRRCGVCIQWTVTQPQKHMNLCHWKPQGWTSEDDTKGSQPHRGRQ